MQPHARDEGLIIDDLDDETLVYDRETHHAHRLNRTAALVWRRCDGRTSPAEIAAHLGAEVPLPVDEEVVHLALRQLDRAGLLRKQPEAARSPGRCSRRSLARRLGLVGSLAVLLPVVESVLAPTPAMAATCVSSCAGQQNGVTCGPPTCAGTCQAGNCI
jgi:hypothetical protein